VLTGGWGAQGDGLPAGFVAKAFLTGVRCIAAPCPSQTEKGLNSSRSAPIAEVDFDAGGFSDEALGRISGDLAAPGGILIAGNRFSFTIAGRPGKGRTATNAYLNLANEPVGADGCIVGGCSGQICSDQEGLVTTCEWREEYACPGAGAARGQAAGGGGWRLAAVLQACPGTP